jgi:hypothetical protein
MSRHDWAVIDLANASRSLERHDTALERAVTCWPADGTPIQRARASRRLVALIANRMTALCWRCQAARKLAFVDVVLRGRPIPKTCSPPGGWGYMGHLSADLYAQNYMRRLCRAMSPFVRAQYVKEQAVADVLERKRQRKEDREAKRLRSAYHDGC